MARSKKKKRRLLIFGPLCLIVLGYFIYTLGYYAYNIYSLKREDALLSEELVKLQDEETALRGEITRLQDPEYIARYARENYLYSKDGEYIIKLSGDEEENADEDGFNVNEYIPYAIPVGTGILIFALVLFRKK